MPTEPFELPFVIRSDMGQAEMARAIQRNFEHLSGIGTQTTVGLERLAELAAEQGAILEGTSTDVVDLEDDFATIPPVSDGNPPSSSPAAEVLSFPGGIYIRWPALANADRVVYEVHVGTTTGFTPSAATLAGELGGIRFIAREANGVALLHGTNYFVRLIAKDADGAAAAGTEAGPVVIGNAADDIVVGTVTAEMFEALLIFTTRLVTGSGSGISEIELDGETNSFNMYDSDGTKTVSFDGQTGDVIIKGQVQFGSSFLRNNTIELLNFPASGTSDPDRVQSSAWSLGDTASWASETTQGNLLTLQVVAVRYDSVVPPTIGTPAGWVLVNSGTHARDGMSMRLSLFKKNGAAPQSGPVTVSITNVSESIVRLEEWSGAEDVTTVNTVLSNGGTDVSTNVPLNLTLSLSGLSNARYLVIHAAGGLITDLVDGHPAMKFDTFPAGTAKDNYYGYGRAWVVINGTSVSIRQNFHHLLAQPGTSDRMQVGLLVVFKAKTVSSPFPSGDRVVFFARGNELWAGDGSGNMSPVLGPSPGAMEMFAGGNTPPGWLLCNGQAVSRTTFNGLFAVIGTTYGAGDGSTTFNVPDMRGRVPYGAGTAVALSVSEGLAEASRSPTHRHDAHNFTSNSPTSGGATRWTGPVNHAFDGPPHLGLNFIIKI